MGVLACDRRGCENIMCDRYSPTFGYICNDCFRELVSLGPVTFIEDFMNSEKTNKIPDEAVEKYYDAVFPLQTGCKI